MTWIGGLPGKDYSLTAEPAREDVRNALQLLDVGASVMALVLDGEDHPAIDDLAKALHAARARLTTALQKLEAAP